MLTDFNKGSKIRLRVHTVYRDVNVSVHECLMLYCACFLFPTDYRCCFCCQTNPGGRESDHPGNMGELELTGYEFQSVCCISAYINHNATGATAKLSGINSG